MPGQGSGNRGLRFVAVEMAETDRGVRCQVASQKRITGCLLLGAVSLLPIPTLWANAAGAPDAQNGSRGQQGNPEVLPPNSSFRGHTYAEWSEAWWVWALSFPVDQNPITTNGVAPCKKGSTGMSGFLWGLEGRPPSLAPYALRFEFRAVCDGECGLDGQGVACAAGEDADLLLFDAPGVADLVPVGEVAGLQI